MRGGGGILVVLNTGEGGGGGVEDQRVHGRFGRINQNTSCSVRHQVQNTPLA